MSPHFQRRMASSLCFPRMSGDEPGAKDDTLNVKVLSPREWG